jgi:hypothetical protein
MAFTALPAVPQVGIPEWQFQFLNGVKQNLEEVTGQRGKTGFQSVISGQIGVQTLDELNLRQVTAAGAGFTISGVPEPVPSLNDYAKLIIDVQTLIGDVENIRVTLNALIQQLKS